MLLINHATLDTNSRVLDPMQLPIDQTAYALVKNQYTTIIIQTKTIESYNAKKN